MRPLNALKLGIALLLIFGVIVSAIYLLAKNPISDVGIALVSIITVVLGFISIEARRPLIAAIIYTLGILIVLFMLI